MALRARQRLGKYVIERRLAEGGFATVFAARDTIEGIRVALKIPYDHLVTGETIEAFRKEVRLVARLDHPGILPIKNADFIDGTFVIAAPLGELTLENRLQKRIATHKALEYSRQMLEAVSHAHEHRIIHCDIKPDNFVIFPPDSIRLTDFGIARVAQKTLRGSGAGTVGYVAPEQAMGRPSFRSDVFSLGLVIYRLLSGTLPEWPYTWPTIGHDRLRQRVAPEMVELLRKAIDPQAERRFATATRMLRAYRAIRSPEIRDRRQTPARQTKSRTTKPNWQTVRKQEFLRYFRKILAVHSECSQCKGPLSEFMTGCPWCGKAQRIYRGPTQFPRSCPQCGRGVKTDWRFCAWCYGPELEIESNRHFSDKRYTAKCHVPECRGPLMPFSRYCPWCHRKTSQAWKIPDNKARCDRCGWGVIHTYWSFCPWCSGRVKS